MNNPRGPKAPRLVAGARLDPATSTEPFKRMATLSAPDRGGNKTTGTYEERTGVLIKRAAAPPGLDSEALDRVWTRLDRRQAFRRRGHVGLSLKWALVAAVLMVSGAVVGAETGVWTWPRVMVRKLTGRAPLPIVFPTVGHARVSGGRVVAARSPVSPAVSPPGVAESPPPDVASPPVVGSARAVRDPRAPPPRRLPESPATEVTPAATLIARDTALADESLLLGRVLTSLRHQGDPSEALVELDRYAARFPAGLLGHEAQSARVDALLMAGRLAEARTALSTLTLGTGARDRELRLIRAELNADKNCAVALEDYRAVLSGNPSGPLVERALWGRAVCRDRLGDESGARADLAEYLVRFPDGPRVALARARLRN